MAMLCFCFDDGLASYLTYLHKDKDIHIVGFNGSSQFMDNYEYITSINADYDSMVKDAVNILNEKIKTKNEGEAVVIKHMTKLCE